MQTNGHISRLHVLSPISPKVLVRNRCKSFVIELKLTLTVPLFMKYLLRARERASARVRFIKLFTDIEEKYVILFSSRVGLSSNNKCH